MATPEEIKYARDFVDSSKLISDILISFSGVESNIPQNHEYWKIIEKHRALCRQNPRNNIA
jgi:hypothetical protein